MASQVEKIPRRGEIYLVNFDPSFGAEIKKMRPALLIQNDVANRYSPVTIVAAITAQFEESLYPTEVLIRATKSGLSKDSVVLLNQIRTIDTRRLIKKLGIVNRETMIKIERALKISLGLLET